jgi:hypothetical protein
MGFFDIGYQDYLGLKLPYITALSGREKADSSGYVDVRNKTIIGGQIVGVGAVKSMWGGLSTGTKKTIALGTAMSGSALLGYLWGGSKKDAATGGAGGSAEVKQDSAPIITPVVTVQPVVTQPADQRIFQYDYSTNTNIISDSPGSSLSTKKEMVATPTASWNTPFTTQLPIKLDIAQEGQADASGGSASSGIDWATIAAIAGVALVAYGYTSRKGSK